MATTKRASIEDPAAANRPLSDDVPYRMVVFKDYDQNGIPVYLVAGVNGAAMGADKALRVAHAKFGGRCFYCKKPLPHEQLTIDHAEPTAKGGKRVIQNLLIACQPCNSKKGDKAIELYKPGAGRDWLSALLRQVQERLDRLDAAEAPKASAPPRPKQGAAAGP
jgi:5-methylcytosine-specific restriction endonuclease McrA